MMISKKEECDIIEDLMPLYVERLTQEETNEWIQKHLLECQHCRQLYELMGDSFTEVLKEEKKKKKVKLFKKVKIRLFLYGYVLLLIAIWLYCMIDAIFF